MASLSVKLKVTHRFVGTVSSCYPFPPENTAGPKTDFERNFHGARRRRSLSQFYSEPLMGPAPRLLLGRRKIIRSRRGFPYSCPHDRRSPLARPFGVQPPELSDRH